MEKQSKCAKPPTSNGLLAKTALLQITITCQPEQISSILTIESPWSFGTLASHCKTFHIDIQDIQFHKLTMETISQPATPGWKTGPDVPHPSTSSTHPVNSKGLPALVALERSPTFPSWTFGDASRLVPR